MISYNAEQGRFEFQLVENYGPRLKPVVKYALREFCISCHQHEGPIFPEMPWTETNNNSLLTRAMKDRLGKSYHGVIVQPRVDSFNNFHGPLQVDSRVRMADDYLSFNDYWQKGCVGSSAEILGCRRKLHKVLIGRQWHDLDDIQGRADQRGKKLAAAATHQVSGFCKRLEEELKDLQKIMVSVKQKTSSILRDRDPLALDGRVGSGDEMRAAYQAPDLDMRLRAVQRAPLPKKFDPLTVKTFAARAGFADYTSSEPFDKKEIDALFIRTQGNLDALDSVLIYPQMDRLLSSNGFSPILVLKGINASLSGRSAARIVERRAVIA